MRFRGGLLALALSLAPLAAEAQPFQGLYIGAGAGYNLPQNVNLDGSGAIKSGSSLNLNGGIVGLGSVGYALGNGFRFELEGNYRQSGVKGLSGSNGQPGLIGNTTALGASGNLHTYGVMANVLFDMDIGVPWLFPYVGGGAGYAWTSGSNLELTQTNTFSSPSPAGLANFIPGGTFKSSTTQGNFAFQAIGGLSFPVPSVPGLSVTTEYRFFGVLGDETFPLTSSSIFNTPSTLKLRNQYNHSFMLGVRYAFNVAAPVPTPGPAEVPAQAPARSYLVFFDWDKATLTDRARQIIKEAADNSSHVQYTRIEVNGYTDTSGSPQYNMGLSIRRANAVKAELIKDGVPANAITTQGFGETHLLVPTGQGVREPQNRRVEIIIR